MHLDIIDTERVAPDGTTLHPRTEPPWTASHSAAHLIVDSVSKSGMAGAVACVPHPDNASPAIINDSRFMLA